MSIPKSEEHKTKISDALSGENNPMFGKAHSVESLDKMSASRGTAIFVYDSQGSLVNTFTSARVAAKEFDTTHKTIMRYVTNGKLLFRDKWKFSLSLITKE
jgi:group I intron endonuclease